MRQREVWHVRTWNRRMKRLVPRLSRWVVPVVVLAAPLAVLLWLRAGTGDSVDATETRAEALVVSPTARTLLAVKARS